MSDELLEYTNAPEYTLTSEDYLSVDEALQATNYFFPIYPPDNYIPDILSACEAECLDTASSGYFCAITYNYTDATPNIDYSSYEINATYNTEFTDSISNFQQINISGNQVWEYTTADDGAAKMNGYDNNAYNENEDWLVSSEIDLSSSTNTYMQLTHAVEYYADGCLFILVSTDFDGSDVTTATWIEITFPDYSGSDKNNYIETDVIDLTAFDGKNIYLAFKYISTTSDAPYWGISNVEVGPYGYKVTGETPYTITTYYEYDGSDWSVMDDIYVLNSGDYELMELEDYFTEDAMASDYLPAYMNLKYPYAQTGNEKTILFDYYNDREILRLADLLTKTDTEWSSSYDYIYYASDPFATTEDGWVFDPTVVFTMTTDDYQIIVDYVNATPELAALNSSTYSNSEYYYGSSAYYGDFDVRAGKYYSGFETWQDGAIEAIGEGLLPNKYPEATTQYKGIDMYYVVHFECYGAAATDYYCTFQCTKSAPDPEFTIVLEEVDGESVGVVPE